MYESKTWSAVRPSSSSSSSLTIPSFSFAYNLATCRVIRHPICLHLYSEFCLFFSRPDVSIHLEIFVLPHFLGLHFSTSCLPTDTLRSQRTREIAGSIWGQNFVHTKAFKNGLICSYDRRKGKGGVRMGVTQKVEARAIGIFVTGYVVKQILQNVRQ